MYKEIEHNFTGVWFPKEVWLDNRLSALDKIILLEIDNLDKEEGCFATNEYLAEFCQCSVSKVSNTVNKLISLGYIELKKFNGRIRILNSCLLKIIRQTTKNYKADYEKLVGANNNNDLSNNKLLSKSNNIIIKRNRNVLDKPKTLEKNNKKSNGLLLEKTKRITSQDKLYNNLINNILVKSKLNNDEIIRDLLVRWLNGLLELKKLPSSNSFEDSLIELEKYSNDEIIEAINNSIKSNYTRFYPKHIDNISSDGINRNSNLTSFEKEKMEKSAKYIDEMYG